MTTEAPRKGLGQPALAVRPDVALLWDGVPLEELGIHNALFSVQFTYTVGRTAPSKKFIAGKPKVGGAQVVFELSDAATARRIAALLETKERPTISIGFGYDGQVGYWVGGFAQGVAPDRKTTKKVGRFKMDTVTWRYPSEGLATVTLSGQSDQALSLVEKTKPRVYTDKTIRQIFEGIADEHGVVLDIDPAVRADVRLSHAIKTVHESDWDFVARYALKAGGIGMHLHQVPASAGKVGASDVATQFSVRHVDEDAPIDDLNPDAYRAQAKTVLRISRLPGFLDLSSLEMTSPIYIGYGATMSPELKAQMHYMASSVTVKVEGYKSGGVPASAAPTKNDDQLTSLPDVVPASTAGANNTGTVVNLSFTGQPYNEWGRPPQKTLAQRVRAKGEIPGTQVYHEVTSSLPAEVDGGVLASEQLAAIALANGYTFEVEIELVPGVPYAQPPALVRLVGTHAHDGLYGIEEATTTWDAENGLSTKLKCKPIDVAQQPKGKKPVDANFELPDVVPASTAGANQQGTVVNLVFNGAPYDKWKDVLAGKPVDQVQKPVPVAATAAEE